MKVKNILKKLNLEKLNYQFCLTEEEINNLKKLSKNEEDWNNFAFAYISKKLKMDFYKTLKISKDTEQNLNKFCQQVSFSSYDKLNSYNFKRIKMKELIKKVYDWIVISSNINKNIILENLKKSNLINHKYFIFYLIYYFYNNRKFEETIFFINYVLDQKIFDNKKDKLYNNLILYKLISLKEKYDYLNNKKIFKEICNTAKILEGFSYLKLISLLECALEYQDKEKFKNIINENIKEIWNYSLIEILSIYELSIYINIPEIVELLNNIIKNKDINIFNENDTEFLIYNFLEGTRLKNQKQRKKFQKLIKEKIKTFSFKHYTNPQITPYS